jgi:hypothetical protein
MAIESLSSDSYQLLVAPLRVYDLPNQMSTWCSMLKVPNCNPALWSCTLYVCNFYFCPGHATTTLNHGCKTPSLLSTLSIYTTVTQLMCRAELSG